MSAVSPTILIVDDCSEDHDVLMRYFEQMTQQQFRLIQTDSGEEGLELTQSEQPDCILLDYQMPDLDGLEFIQTLAKSEEKRFIPVLMLSGYGNEGVASEAIKGGASDYLIKNKLTSEGLYRAITRAMEKARLLETNERQYGEIERSYRELEQFAHTASHDLQAPVRRITKFLELLEMDLQGSLSARAKDYLDRALKGAAHMQGLIQDLLEYSLVGGAKNKMESVNLKDVVKEVLVQLEVMVSSSNATIEVGDLPTVLGNSTFLQQLFQNLITNAIKFRGEPPLTVKIFADWQALNGVSKWIVTVQDNGVGIPSDAFEQIFGIFQRLENGSHTEGTGIGLALCKKIVELHEGRIWVESTVNEGTAFHFTLSPSVAGEKEEVVQAATAESSVPG
ncbi:MAG: ATP-binding protein [Nitrospirales bacterium]